MVALERSIPAMEVRTRIGFMGDKYSLAPLPSWGIPHGQHWPALLDRYKGSKLFRPVKWVGDGPGAKIAPMAFGACHNLATPWSALVLPPSSSKYYRSKEQFS